MKDEIDIECVFESSLEYAIDWYENVIIRMIIQEKDSDLMFKRAIQAYKRGTVIKKSELV